MKKTVTFSMLMLGLLAVVAFGMLVLGLSTILCACSGAVEQAPLDSGVSAENPAPSTSLDDQSQAARREDAAAPPTSAGPRTIRASFSERTVLIELLDNPTTNDLYNRLPLELRFSDFNQTEKIAYPPDALQLEGSPDACDPAPGDLALYAPWGNLSLFYEDFRYSEGLVPLGTSVEGAEYLSEIGEDEPVVFERAD